MVEGMDKASSIISLDNDPKWMKHVLLAYQNDTRVKLLCTDGGAWLDTYQGKDFDLVFADAWPGKYSHLDLLLDRIKVGGFYIIDDMLPKAIGLKDMIKRCCSCSPIYAKGKTLAILNSIGRLVWW